MVGMLINRHSHKKGGCTCDEACQPLFHSWENYFVVRNQNRTACVIHSEAGRSDILGLGDKCKTAS